MKTRDEQRIDNRKKIWELWWRELLKDALPTCFYMEPTAHVIKRIVQNAFYRGYEEGYELGYIHGGEAADEDASDW